MEHAKPQDILEEFNLFYLKKIASEFGYTIEGNRKDAYVNLLKRKRWARNEIEILVRYLKESRKSYISYSNAQIIKSDDLQTKNLDEISKTLELAPPQNTGEEFISGFDDVLVEENIISGFFLDKTSRIITVGKEALVEVTTISIPFSIFKEKGYILIKTNNTKYAKLCREALLETLGLNTLYFALPRGIREEGSDARALNSNAKDFVEKLQTEEINGVYLKIEGDSKIRRIRYRGNEDILEESKIKNEIRDGAILDGIQGLIREGDVLMEFSCRWGWIPSIKIFGENVEKTMLDSCLNKIFNAYVEQILK